MLQFVFTHTGMTVGFSDRPHGIVGVMRNGPQIAQDLIQVATASELPAMSTASLCRSEWTHIDPAG